MTVAFRYVSRLGKVAISCYCSKEFMYVILRERGVLFQILFMSEFTQVYLNLDLWGKYYYYFFLVTFINVVEGLRAHTKLFDKNPLAKTYNYFARYCNTFYCRTLHVAHFPLCNN